jgi:hypothetical protein
MDSKFKKSVINLLVAKGLGTETTASEYVSTLDDVTAKGLFEFLMESQGGASKNLPGQKGGLVAGINKLFDARRSNVTTSLPDKPYLLSRPAKEKSIAKMDEAFEKSDAHFVEGLKLLLENRNEDRHSVLNAWVKELSDESFPLTINTAKVKAATEIQKLTNDVQKKLEVDRLKISKLAKKHRDAADKKQ